MRIPLFGTIDPRNTRPFYRQMFLILILSGLIILIGMSAGSDSAISTLRVVVAVIVTGLITVGVAGAVYDYLRYDRERSRDRALSEAATKRSESHGPAADIGGLPTSTPQAVNFSDEMSKLLQEGASISNSAAEPIKQKWSDLVDRTVTHYEDEGRVAHLQKTANLIRERFQEEIEALGGRGRVNLSIGAGFAVFGIVTLAIIAFYFNYNTLEDFSVRFLPRFLFVIFIEFLAYFFLNLYRHGIFEIKYFQNESTNIEARCIALQSAILARDGDLIKTICGKLAETERNFLLKKGETTVDMRLREMAESRDSKLTDELRKMTDTLTSMLKRGQQDPAR